MQLLRDTLHSLDNFEALNSRVARECEQMTLRIKFGKIYKQLESSSLNVVKTMYYVTLTDADIKGFLLLKH